MRGKMQPPFLLRHGFGRGETEDQTDGRNGCGRPSGGGACSRYAIEAIMAFKVALGRIAFDAFS